MLIPSATIVMKAPNDATGLISVSMRILRSDVYHDVNPFVEADDERAFKGL